MPNFRYIVANNQGKRLSGTIESESEATARKELNNLGFSILEITKTEKEAVKASLPKFQFEAVDKTSKVVTGTIPATSKEEAYKRLKEEYQLTVLAIYPENASPEEIAKAKAEGTAALEQELQSVAESSKEASKEEKGKSEEDIKKEQFQRNKVENIIKEVVELLKKFDKEFDKAQKNEINKRIDKVLRIKHSTNIDYILASAEDLLNYIKEQEQSLKEKASSEKRFELKMETKSLLGELKQTQKPKSLSEDILGKIGKWKESQSEKTKKQSAFNKFLLAILGPIQRFFTTPPEIKSLKNEISLYNKQLIELVTLYIKEPTSDYKDKVKQSIKTVWGQRKKTKQKIKDVKKAIKEKREKKSGSKEDEFSISILDEMNSLSGWILAFFIAYYFITLYLRSKNFGLTTVPEGFRVFESHVFKYLFVVIFLLHSSLAVKLNFFKTNRLVSLLLILVFLIGTSLTLLNF
ncbi:hypothetical protein GF354_06625 [Candidatus Peregrinibacteria bacterium]|nr:hypothetical protein [Candidatus Peregrinibacteria bacterium]